MKPLFPCVAVLLCPLLSMDFARSEETAPNVSAGEAGEAAPTVPPERPAAQQSSQAARPEPLDPAFRAKIVTGDRSRDFDSPTRALGELQRAAGLRRRSGKDDGLAFAAVLTVNGVEYEFSDPDDARSACRAVVDGLRRLARVRAALGDLGTIPEIDPAAAADEDQRRGTPEALQTVRQRVNEALRQEVQRNQGRMRSQQRMQQTEIEAVRELLARALSAASADQESAAATAQAGGEQ